MEAKDSDIIGKRVCLKDAYGTIRFFGKLHNNEKAGDDNWYGIEWDDSSKGRNNGSVNGFQYFVPLFHDPTDNCCSFIREGKIPFGISLKQALEEKYQANKELSEEERKLLEEEESKVLVVNTIKEGQKLIEVVGIEKSYKWRYDIYEGTEFLCQNMKIDSIGQNGEIKKLIPKCKHLYLDKNLLSSWDDFFMITSQCILIETLNLTDNIFLPIDSSYFELKSSIPKLVNPHLKVLVLIGMKLDWSQIDLLLPYLTYLEELHLCRNFCCTISSKYTLPKGVFNDLKYLNLEENRITDWDELSEFRKLKSLTRLGLGINQIKSVTHRPGFRELTSLDLYDNFIDSWDSINQINEYSEIRKLRITNNPLSNQDTKEKIRQNMIARARYLELYNGSQVSKVERKDCEVFYVKKCYMEYLQANGGQEAAKVDKIDDPRLADFMNKHHPRWYELIEIHGSPIELVNSQKLSHQENIKSSSVNVVLISKFSGSEGKTFKKKLLPSMTVEKLKSLCCKLFKSDILCIKLTFKDHDQDTYYDMDDNLRQLSFYSICDGCEIYCSDKEAN